MLPSGTYTVSQLGDELREIVSETLSGVWVAGEIRRVTVSRRDHVYFELVEKGRGDDVVGSLQAVLFRRDHQRVRRVLARAGVELREGVTVRCLGGLDFYPPSGRLQFIARDVDPLFSLGELARRRQQTLSSLEASGLLDRNAELELPLLPLGVALVTSLGSAAERDLTSTLEACPYAFQVRRFDVAVQGPNAELEIPDAFERIAQIAGRERLDVVVLVRGGGSKTDLAAFDSLAVAQAIALSPLPVLTGLGHEIDESVADKVAHRSLKTPTAVGDFLVRVIEDSEQSLEAAATALRAAAERRLEAARRGVLSAELSLQRAGGRLRGAARRLERSTQRLAVLAAARLHAAGGRVTALEQRIEVVTGPRLRGAKSSVSGLAEALARASRRSLDGAGERLEQKRRLIESLSPVRTLQRGFSVTRDVQGALIRDADQVPEGRQLITQLASGTLRSTVAGRLDLDQGQRGQGDPESRVE